MTNDFTTFADLAEALRCCSRTGDCPSSCPRHNHDLRGCITRLKLDAAEAIEQLSAQAAVAENPLKRWEASHDA